MKEKQIEMESVCTPQALFVERAVHRLGYINDIDENFKMSNVHVKTV